MAKWTTLLACAAGLSLSLACTDAARRTGGGGERPLGDGGSGGTCTGTFPSYWQDPDPRFADMWRGQTVSNAPPEGWSGPVFRLSDAYPAEPVDDAASQPWRDARFDALFVPSTEPAAKTKLADEYAWAVMRYIQEGNIDRGDVSRDWTLCDNPGRRWYHMPFQTYDVLSGREFVHGLTREAPVSFNVKAKDHPGASITLATTMWAVAFFNPTAAYTLGTVWRPDGSAAVPTADVAFHEGAVVGKPLFSTATPAQLPMLENMPAWHANISDPAFCNCVSASGGRCTMAEQSQQCARTTQAWGPVRLLQFDIAVRDHRASGTQWVFGTFVADGQRKATEPNPWNRISPLGLMWGNDPPPAGSLAHAHPPDPRAGGFAEEVIFWDTVDMLNAAGGEVLSKRPGHLGCNSRLNGPADNDNSSCLSCHMTASVADARLRTPPIIAQFAGRKPDGSPGLTFECVTPDAGDPSRGRDAAGAPARVVDGVGFAQLDGLYFANTAAATPVNMTVETAKGPRNVLGDQPRYAHGRSSWVSLDYSLQLSISLVQWGQWQQHQKLDAAAPRVHAAVLPGR
jgi:hypothetical protein